MTFPASQLTPVQAWPRAQNRAASTKQLLQTVNAASLVGPIPRTQLLKVMGQLSGAVVLFNTYKAVPGISQYVKDQLDDQAKDIAADFTIMVSSIETLRDWIFNNFPKHASGAWLAQAFDNAGVATELTFTTAELTTYRVNADAVIATIG